VEETELLAQIKVFHEKSGKVSGSPNIYKDLVAAGVPCSLNRVARIMRKYGIASRIRKRHVVTTDSRHTMPVAPNLLEQNFHVDQINKIWTGDITYIPTKEGYLYLAVVLDLGSRRPVGWSMKPTMDRSIVIDAFNGAYRDRRPQPGLIFHSDRGSQYASNDFQNTLKNAKALCSMSGKGNCYDNAVTESFFSTLKCELIGLTGFATREEARAAIFEWLVVRYSRQRRHSSLGYKTPEEFEQQRRQAA
jgi:transposase InsO family protein